MRIFVVMGILVVFFILAGCSTNPITSTQTVPINDNSPPPADNNADVSSDQGGNSGGYDTEPAIDNPKYDDDVPNEESPLYPN
jgi:hypothetical protein